MCLFHFFCSVMSVSFRFCTFDIKSMEFQEYCPNPVDTSGVELPIELHSLVEQMARNVHDVWAVSRMNEGWHYGDERNDQEKTHPCLVSYDSLPDSEKAYDRDTAVTTLKLILKLGFRIEKDSE